jgi:hypothetical protein
MTKTYEGGCTCGRVRYVVNGEPLRGGVCHCTDCRQETGSVFMAYGDWPLDGFEAIGEREAFRGRQFCPSCGSRLFDVDEAKGYVEIRLGTLDKAPSGILIDEELWVKRREPWLEPIVGARQFEENRE